MAASGDLGVAVLIVNYNSGKYLRRALEALSHQTVRDFRVIVVDNASSDGSAEGIEQSTATPPFASGLGAGGRADPAQVRRPTRR